MDDTRAGRAQAQLRAGVYGRLSETYDAAESVPTQLEHGESVASIARDWTARGIRPVAAAQWWPTSIVGMLTSPRLAGLREWQGTKYPATPGPAIIRTHTHWRLGELVAGPAPREARG